MTKKFKQLMTKSMKQHLKDMEKKAKEGGKEVIIPKSDKKSSLQEIIKTKEQADLFMKLLKNA